MSLLMEALKKAEEAKRLVSESNAAGPAAGPELTLKPMTPTKVSSASPLPDLSLHIDSVDADLATESTEAPARRRAPASASTPHSDLAPGEASERAAVRNVFSAKQPVRSRALLWVLLGLSSLAVLAFGGYFWWQLQSVSGASLARPVPPVPSSSPLPSSPPLPQNVQTQDSPVATIEAAKPPPEKIPAPDFSAPRPALEQTSSLERSVRAQQPSASAAPAAPDSPVRLSRVQPASNQILERAYEGLQAGKFDQAQREYEQVLRNDAKNTDALLGLATIAARQGQSERAQALYLRALESDPNDATAQAGLINSKGQADPGQSESRLKTALAAQPDSSALHFALGNVYARQARWSEAQQAYFHAYSSEPDNADFIFNLAVSLDHLHQNRLAAQYYQMALNAAATNNAMSSNANSTSFDRNQVKNRILELQP